MYFYLARGGFAIRRTSKHFSRCPVNHTLEQAVNRGTASRHTGISAFTDSIKARWTITRSTREIIVGNRLWWLFCQISRKKTKPYRIIRDNGDVEEVINALRSTMNPFNAEGADTAKLYHLSSGRAASNDMKDDLINVVSKHAKGTTWTDKFRQECKENPARFEKPIKRKKLKKFTTDAKKMNIPQKDLKVKEVLCTRDIWERPVYLAAVHNLELVHVMSWFLYHLLILIVLWTEQTNHPSWENWRKTSNQESWTSRILMCA